MRQIYPQKTHTKAYTKANETDPKGMFLQGRGSGSPSRYITSAIQRYSEWASGQSERPSSTCRGQWLVPEDHLQKMIPRDAKLHTICYSIGYEPIVTHGIIDVIGPSLYCCYRWYKTNWLLNLL